MTPTRSSSSPACPPSAPSPRPPARRLPDKRSADPAAFVAQVLPPGAPVFIGASGGGDSTALLHLLAPVARTQGRALVAGIVDHALRPGSADDAARAAQIARDLGADPHLLTLAWPDGPRTAQAPARAARYAALAGLARRIGAGVLFLGHTADDQAETVFIRREAGSGGRGLAGMADLSPCPVWPEGRDLWLARPLLGWRRADLRDLLHTARIDWLEDPANALPRYARVRARAALEGGGAEALMALAGAQAEAAADADRAALAWLADADLGEDTARLPGPGPGERRALSTVLTAYGGAVREPSPEAVARLAVRGQGALAGARMGLGRVVGRDPGGVHGRRGGGRGVAPLPLPAGEPVVWDNRVELTAAGPGLRAEPPGRGGRLAPVLTGPAAIRWLPADRVRRLLHRGA